jgi:hypothetical protein
LAHPKPKASPQPDDVISTPNAASQIDDAIEAPEVAPDDFEIDAEPGDATAFDNAGEEINFGPGVPCVPTVADVPLEFLTPAEDFEIDAEPGEVTAIKALEDFEEFRAAHQISVVQYVDDESPASLTLETKFPLIAGYFEKDEIGFARVDLDENPDIRSAFYPGPLPCTVVFYRNPANFGGFLARPIFAHRVLGVHPQEIMDVIQDVVDDPVAAMNPAPKSPTSEEIAMILAQSGGAKRIITQEEIDELRKRHQISVHTVPYNAPEFLSATYGFKINAKPGKVTLLKTQDDLNEFTDAHDITVVEFLDPRRPESRVLETNFPLLAGYFEKDGIAFARVDDLDVDAE